MGDNLDDKIKQLIAFLNYHTSLYDKGCPQISDYEWDEKYFELVKLENETGIYYKDSPTQKINYENKNQLNKITHSHPMLSLDKTKDINEIKSFIKDKEYIVMAKMDGLTCSLTYENGRLIAAETRGNGIVGEDILHNAIVVKNIPNKINYKNTLVVDGEIICDYNTFEEFKNDYKNPRNFASGSIRLLDSKECEKRKLSFVAWDVIQGFTDNEFLSTRLIELKNIGFTIVPFQVGNETENEEVEHSIEEIKRYCKDKYPIDGVVFKYNKVKEYLAEGRTDHHFKGGLAYKFYDDEYETTLKDIVYDIGRTGVLTPVAIFDSIDIDGTECSRASLHNISVLMETLHCPGWEGQKIKVFKANQIIPQISWAEEDNGHIEYYISYPHQCPICGEPTIFKENNGVKILMCGNDNCEGKLLNRFDHFCGKKGLDIKGISKATIEKLMNWGWLNTYQDIFLLKEHREQWIKKPGFGVTSVDKILNAIKETKENITLDKVIAAAGIPEIGSRVAKDLAQHYDTWSDFRAETNFLQYEGIGEVMNNNILTFDYDDLNLDYTINLHLKIKKKENTQIKEHSSIEGKTFCITGSLNKNGQFKTRAKLQADIEANGGKVVSSMSSKVNYLINNDINSTSAKNKAAIAAHIPIITEEDYIALICK